MKKFVEFEIHDYMDEYPETTIRVMKGETLADIEASSREYAKKMTELYSGGTTNLVRVMNAEEARAWLDTEIAKLKITREDDLLWIKNVEDLYIECYEF